MPEIHHGREPDGQTSESLPAQAERTGVIVVAAGESRRMNGVDKVFTPLLDLPLVCHAVEPFESSPIVDEVVIVLSVDKVPLGQELARQRGWRKATPERVCEGGPRRQDSVRMGLLQLTPCSWVAVHDGARPCASPDLLERGIEAARETGAAVAAVPAKDTIKAVSPLGVVESTLPRETLWLVQTPQVFRYGLLMEAHESCSGTFTDDASMVESLGNRVKVFMGSYTNLKVTTPEDLQLAEVLLRTHRGPVLAKDEDHR